MVKIKTKINKDLVVSKKEKKGFRKSVFSIIINPNKSAVNDYDMITPEVKKWLIIACKYIFSKKTGRILETIKCVDKKISSRQEFIDKLINVDCVISIEKGESKGFIHANIKLDVEHKTKVHVDTQFITKIVNKLMSRVFENPNCFIKVTHIPAAVHDFNGYVSHGKEYEIDF